ncbi:MAG TPA: permease-like cell division protein FtsX, partial [Gammaproteobacteria bacterium]|nr:permease-like cell division protein FtsX [Gammaproteobacteria bacterium]
MADRHARRARGRLRLDTYIARHLQALFFTLGRLTRAPISSLMTVIVIGVALALPSGLQVLINNTRQLSGAWEGSARITIFLKRDLSADAARSVANSIQARPDVTDVKLIPAAAALEEFKTHSGFG